MCHETRARLRTFTHPWGEVADTVVAVRAYDRDAGTVEELPAADCGFAYRSSVFKRTPGRWVVLAVSFALQRRPHSAPVRYGELARALGIAEGETAPLADVRGAVLALRRGKGMVIDPADPDSVSAGSFFTNPVLDADHWAALQQRVEGAPSYPEPDGRVKVPAAWLRRSSRRGKASKETSMAWSRLRLLRSRLWPKDRRLSGAYAR